MYRVKLRMRILYLSILVFLASDVFSQSEEIERFSRRLQALGFDMVECREDEERQKAHDEFNLVLDSLINEPGSFRHSFENVRNIRVLKPKDNSFRIMTWGFRFPNDSFIFYGVLQGPGEDGMLYWLTDSSYAMGNNQTSHYADLTPDRWYGAMYYQLETIKYRKETYYLLVGWNGQTIKSDQKLLEVLSFNDQGEPVFGLPVFDMGNGQMLQNRVIWEFKNGAAVALRVEDNLKTILVEHIVPASPNAKGIYSLYLPDGTYDYFEFKKGTWKFGTLYFER